jgi:RimJ/RimL family protein N-acetyltransferase
MQAFQRPLQPEAAAMDAMLRPGEVHDAWQLKNGTAIMLRAVRPDDGEKMQALVRGLSMQSRCRRFFYPVRQLVPSMLARFTDADPMHAITLLAVVPQNGEEIAVGMAQYVAEPYPQRCEFAVVVSDAWQCNGIAARLIRNLICIARTAGIERIEGDILADNEPMRRLLIGMDFTIVRHPGDALLMKAGKALAAPSWTCSDLAVLALHARQMQPMAHA